MLPADVIAGIACGTSASFATLVELDSDSDLAAFLYGSKQRAVFTSTGGALLVGWAVNPLAGIVFELIYYPACWMKSRIVQNTLEKLARENEPGSVHEIEVEPDRWVEVTLAKPAIVTNYDQYDIPLAA